MRRLTIVLSYYNQSDALKQHIGYWVNYPEEIRNKLSFCIVDDCSSDAAADVLSKAPGIGELDIQLLSVKNDLLWNVGDARNLGLKMVSTEWALILDMDTIVDQPFDGMNLSSLLGLARLALDGGHG